MKSIILTALVALLLSGTGLKLYAQQLAPVKGSVLGTIKDPEQNFAMSSATIVLFKAADSSLVSYQIADVYGKFTFKEVPLRQEFYVEVSNIGFHTLRKPFTLTKAGEVFDLGTIELKHTNTTLKEVVVRVPPIRMNGDTLEFNPAAFRLDSNAVVEDLLKKVPNVTVWSDGLITVNGREVKTLLVDGKFFFGGSFKVATQNLPNNAIQKVQVYKEENRGKLDSNLVMNLKLKKNKQNGMFGKLALGGGTGKRFETDANVNVFSKQMQLTLGAASNNTNKVFNTIDTLLASSTFKGSANELDFQSDFRLPGVNRTSVAGARLNYNLLKIQRPNQRNDFDVSFFSQHKKVDIDWNSVTLNTVESSSRNLSRLNSNVVSNNGFRQVSGGYHYKGYVHTLNVNADFNHRNSLYQSVSTQAVANNDVLSSRNSSAFNDSSRTNSLLVNMNYAYSPKWNQLGKRVGFIPINLSYSGNYDEVAGLTSRNTAFVSFIRPASNYSVNRQYDYNYRTYKNNALLTVHELEQLLFPGLVRYFHLSLSHRYKSDLQEQTNLVQDDLPGNRRYNSYLSNTLRTQMQRNTSSLDFTFNLQSENITNRYNKSLQLSIAPTLDHIDFETISQKAFQNFNRPYLTVFPDVQLSKRKNIYGRHSWDASMAYRNEVNIPTIYQLAPLVDSAQVYYLRFGNPKVSKEVIRQFVASFSWTDEHPGNPFTIKSDAYYHYSDNKITDSLMIDPDNRQRVFAINAGRYQGMGASLEARKAINWKTSNLKLFLWANLYSQRLPIYVNQQFAINQSINSRFAFRATYGLGDFLLTEFRENLDIYKTEQAAFTSNYTGYTFAHAFNVNFNFTKSLSLNSNMTLNENMSSGQNAVRFTIWNAFLSYRFLKKQNGMIKLSALDLLRQNINVVNTYGINSFTTITRNSLQQYFLASLVYYPKFFGNF